MSVRCRRPPSTRQPGVKAAERIGVAPTPPPGSPAKPASSSHILTSFSWICIHVLYSIDSLDRAYLCANSTLPAESPIYHRHAILYFDSSMRANINTETTTSTFAALNKNHNLTSNVFLFCAPSLHPKLGWVLEVALSLLYRKLGRPEEERSWQLQKAHPIHDHERN
jgi:hypothetical protein